MKRLALLALAVLVAGCMTPTRPSDPVARGDVPPTPGTVFAHHTLVGTGGDAETSHAVSPDGKTVLACSHGGFTQPSPWWASEDGGNTFRRLLPAPNAPVGGDCDVAILEDGTWVEVIDTLATAVVISTADQGATFRFAYAAGMLLGNVDRPWLQAVGSTLYLSYADIMAAEPYVVLFHKSTDGGRTWSSPTVMARVHDAEYTNCWQGHMTVRDAGRTIRVPFGCWLGSDPTDFPPIALFFAASGDAGTTWTFEPGPEAPGATGVPTASYAGDGRLWLAYMQDVEEARHVMVRYSKDDGKTWSAAVPAGTLAGPRQYWPWIDGRPDGSATLAWMDHDAPANATSKENWWQPHAARVGANESMPILFSNPVGTPWQGSTIFEYFMVRHDAQGVASIVYPMGGPGCKETPPIPAPGTPRNEVCVHFLLEGGAP